MCMTLKEKKTCSSSTTLLLFMSPPAIVSPSSPPIAMKTTTCWPIRLPSHQCYRMSSSNYPLPSLFARCVVTATDWSSIIQMSISTLSSTSISSCSMLIGLSKSSSRASMRCLVNQPSRMGGVYSVADSRTWWSFVVWLRPFFLGPARLNLTSQFCVGRRMHFARACRTSGWRACYRRSSECSLNNLSPDLHSLSNLSLDWHSKCLIKLTLTHCLN